MSVQYHHRQQQQQRQNLWEILFAAITTSFHLVFSSFQFVALSTSTTNNNSNTITADSFHDDDAKLTTCAALPVL